MGSFLIAAARAGVVDQTREAEVSESCESVRRELVSSLLSGLLRRNCELTGRKAIGPSGKNLCHAVVMPTPRSSAETSRLATMPWTS